MAMKFFCAICVLLPAIFPTLAGTIDPIPVNVSNGLTQQLNPEDKLMFTISDRSFAVNAAQRGLSVYPAQVTFQFVTALQTNTGDFTALLEATDGSLSVDFPGTISWLTGRMQSSGYTGAVSVLYGSMSLSSTLARELFAGSSAVLVLENQGESMDIGLPPYSLAQDLSVSFSGTGFGVSGPVTRVQYMDPPARIGVPEPNPGLLLAVAALPWAAAGKLVHRLADCIIQRVYGFVKLLDHCLQSALAL